MYILIYKTQNMNSAFCLLSMFRGVRHLGNALTHTDTLSSKLYGPKTSLQISVALYRLYFVASFQWAIYYSALMQVQIVMLFYHLFALLDEAVHFISIIYFFVCNITISLHPHKISHPWEELNYLHI